MRHGAYKIWLLVVCASLFGYLCRAQLTIQFQSAVYGQSIDGLSLVQLINSSGESVRGKITIRVKELTTGDVIRVSIFNALIARGTNSIDKQAFSTASFVFGNNYFGTTARQSGKFPEGEYEYCFEVEITDSKTTWTSPFFDNCFIQQLLPMTPLLLINPVDGDESCNTRPDFTWQSPLPLPADARCRLVLAELKDKQDIAEAINYNTPIVNQGYIQGNRMLYPAGLPELKKDKKYVWQVTVYLNTTILKKSEIWTYEVKCEQPKENLNTDSYRELKETDDGSFYVASQFLRFSLNNPYTSGFLEYSIVSMAEPNTSIKGLPALKLLPGINKYDIDLREIKSFKNNEEYLLKTRLANGTELRLRFLYKTE